MYLPTQFILLKMKNLSNNKTEFHSALCVVCEQFTVLKVQFELVVVDQIFELSITSNHNLEPSQNLVDNVKDIVTKLGFLFEHVYFFKRNNYVHSPSRQC